jgi:xylulokinase
VEPKNRRNAVPIREGKYILAIDLGTSGPKVGLVSVDGEIVASEFEETPLLLLPNGGAEQRPDDWWAAITKATRKVIGQNAVPLDDIVALSCTSQYSSTVAVGRNGRPLMNAINWMDTRGARYVQQITGGPIKIEGYGIDKLWTWVRLTGGIPPAPAKTRLPTFSTSNTNSLRFTARLASLSNRRITSTCG